MKFIENVMKLQPENKTESNECQNPEWWHWPKKKQKKQPSHHVSLGVEFDSSSTGS